jgi:hypothetical protein
MTTPPRIWTTATCTRCAHTRYPVLSPAFDPATFRCHRCLMTLAGHLTSDPKPAPDSPRRRNILKARAARPPSSPPEPFPTS